jgi:glycosyltransferase involved in cell wall biosynthesis
MKVLIIMDVLNGHSGTSKIILSLARGMIESGNDVLLLAFGRTKDWSNLQDKLRMIQFILVDRKISDLIEYPFRIYAKKKFWYFTAEDITHISRQIYVSKTIKARSFKPDIVILSNVQVAFTLFTLNHKIKPCLIIHEPINPVGYGALLGRIILFFLKEILRRKGLFISISEPSRLGSTKDLQSKIIVLPPIAFENVSVTRTKEKSILLDTRWTVDRDPFFLLGVIADLPGIKFYMCGNFPQRSLLNNFIGSLKERGYDNLCEIHSEISQEELNVLYEKCMILMRWSGLNERGNSASVMNAISYECIPIVDLNLGEIPDLLKREVSPEIVVKRKETEFAKIVNKIFNDEKEYAELIAKIRILKTKYTWKDYSMKLLSFLER